MALPDYQSLMLPLLKLTVNQEVNRIQDLIENLAKEFHLSREELEELLPSGRQPKFSNRVHWAKTYLVKAALLESAGRGRVKITSRGLTVISKNPTKIDNTFLEQFPEYRAFRNRSYSDAQNILKAISEDQAKIETPEELLESSYRTLKAALASELLERIKNMPPAFFENLVVDLLIAMGYGGTAEDAGRVVGKSGDGGIDGIIKQDKLGLDVIYIQAKRWKNDVGSPEIRTFLGSLQTRQSRKGVFITTSDFTRDALEVIKNLGSGIVLINGNQLADLMIEHGIGVAKIASYQVNKVDLDYFEYD